jgi:hypothetical protein
MATCLFSIGKLNFYIISVQHALELFRVELPPTERYLRWQGI